MNISVIRIGLVIILVLLVIIVVLLLNAHIVKNKEIYMILYFFVGYILSFVMILAILASADNLYDNKEPKRIIKEEVIESKEIEEAYILNNNLYIDNDYTEVDKIIRDKVSKATLEKVKVLFSMYNDSIYGTVYIYILHIPEDYKLPEDNLTKEYTTKELSKQYIYKEIQE